VYCQDCGYTKKNEEDKYVCLNCGAEMQYGIANY
jgi:transposase